MSASYPYGLVLESSADWEEWFFLIRTRARLEGIWEFINPDLEEEPVLKMPEFPQASEIRSDARSFKELTAIEREYHWFLIEVYNHDRTQAEKKRTAITNLYMHVLSHLHRSNLVFVFGAETLYQTLTILKQHLAPYDRARRLEIAKRY